MTGWEALKKQWTDQYVEIRSKHPELARFEGKVGRVVTVNCNGLCLVDFQDGGWYDISPQALTHCPNQEAASNRFRSPKSATQRLPVRQS